jgi:hypothetical protein
MKVIIQCAGSKRQNAGMLKTKDGRSVFFVGNPGLVRGTASRVYARPDDLSDQGVSWRQVASAYNENGNAKLLGIVPAFELYDNGIYRALVARFGISGVFVLSAGWGLIKADFLTPNYDITFSAAADKLVRRRKSEKYNDFCMLPNDTDDTIVFLGGKDYIPLFVELTRTVKGKRTVFYNSISPPIAPGCKLKKFETRTKTNWHYECAAALIGGSISVD